jgi:hypothetical protein
VYLNLVKLPEAKKKKKVKCYWVEFITIKANKLNKGLSFRVLCIDINFENSLLEQKYNLIPERLS